MSRSKEVFISPTKGPLTIGEVIKEVVNFIAEDSQLPYTLVIGSDSQVKRQNGVQEVDYVTAIIIHRHGHGGCYFWNKKKGEAYSLRDRIHRETLLSLEWAHRMVPLIQEAVHVHAPYELEIHIDVGEFGKTREMINEVVGMVTGSGYVAKTKPESYGASSIADKHT